MSVKRKLNTKSLGEKCDALKDLESGMSNKEVAEKYDVPKNTISTWLKNKNKNKYRAASDKSSNTRKKFRESDYERVDKVVFKWFLAQRSQNVPIDGVFVKEKALLYAKELGFKDFQASDGWLRRWKDKVFIMQCTPFCCWSIFVLSLKNRFHLIAQRHGFCHLPHFRCCWIFLCSSWI